jgi:hypothetical protein
MSEQLDSNTEPSFTYATEPNYAITALKPPTVLTITGGNQKVLMNIHANGVVEWLGDPSEAAKVFTDSLRGYWFNPFKKWFDAVQTLATAQTMLITPDHDPKEVLDEILYRISLDVHSD